MVGRLLTLPVRVVTAAVTAAVLETALVLADRDPAAEVVQLDDPIGAWELPALRLRGSCG